MHSKGVVSYMRRRGLERMSLEEEGVIEDDD